MRQTIRGEKREQVAKRAVVRTPTTPTTSPRAETASPKPKQSNEDTAARLTKSLENVTKAHEELKAELRQTEKIKDPSERLRQQDIARAKYQKAIDEHDALTAELSETPTPRTATPTTPPRADTTTPKPGAAIEQVNALRAEIESNKRILDTIDPSAQTGEYAMNRKNRIAEAQKEIDRIDAEAMGQGKAGNDFTHHEQRRAQVEQDIQRTDGDLAKVKADLKAINERIMQTDPRAGGKYDAYVDEQLDSLRVQRRDLIERQSTTERELEMHKTKLSQIRQDAAPKVANRLGAPEHQKLQNSVRDAENLINYGKTRGDNGKMRKMTPSELAMNQRALDYSKRRLAEYEQGAVSSRATTPTTPTTTKADDSVNGTPRKYGARAGEVIAGNLGRDTGGKFTRVGGEGSIVRAAINRGFAAAGGGGKRGAKRAAVSAAQKKRQQADTGAGVMDKIGLDASDWDYLASDKPQDATDPQFARLIEQGLMDNVGGMAYPSALGRKVAAAAGAGNEDKAKELLARDTAKRNARQAKIDAQISAYDEIIGDKTASPRARAIAARKRTVLIGQSGTSTKADDGYTPPDGVRAQAKRGLALRSEFGRGGTSVGIARARDLSNGKRMSRDTIMRMASFFARHAVDKRPDWGNPSNPSNGYIAHLLWGGDAGKSWANKIANQIKANKE